MNSVNSTTYIRRPPNVTPKEECLFYTKEILLGRLFLGSYLERRYVSILSEYRDVIIISNEENEFCQDLDKVKKKWINMANIKWTGISGPDVKSEKSTHRLWVKLSNLPFDSYWFQIKNITIVGDELTFQLKCIRKAPSATQSLCQKILSQNEESTSGDTSFNCYEIINYNIKNCVENVQRSVRETYAAIQPHLTWENCLTAVKIIFATLIALVTSLVSCIQSIAEYLLILLRELGNLVQAFTPIVIHLIDLFAKIIGGIFILIFGVFKINRPQNFMQPHRNMNVRYVPLPAPDSNWEERNRLLKEQLFTVRIPQK